ncbi:hypothetical protein [Nonomuraea turcica]|uniref:hypothetical protein n=1 Tax=Nonomuraea sp. G32 TaxID=3067274 RepID=UPI00273C7E04|nr:hypothetical protein [Nonomuraea sp. G32]MDP4510868.1 hypothetical protein [Nonomuraea sp. G32]
MRGQEPGSEHDHREAAGSARPATPPPSFGQTNGGDAPPAFAPFEEADDDETLSVVPLIKGPAPELPGPIREDAQPWEVPGDDAAPYDWFADHTDTDPRPGHPPTADPPTAPWAAKAPAWPIEPVVPGAPPWEPPPAFTAAAAGMPVWPGPVSDPHALPPWPAATGELVAEPDADEPDTPAAFDPNATEPDGVTRPAHYFDPEAARREAAQQRPDQPGSGLPDAAAPGGAQASTPQTIAPQTTAPQATAPQTTPLQATAPQARVTEGQTTPREAHSTPHDDAPETGTPDQGAPQGTTQQRTTVPLAAPIAPEREDTRPIAREDTTRPASDGTGLPGQFFDPKAAKRDQPHPATAHGFDPNAPTPATARPAEPGDVPVWPPHSPVTQKLPDLPFSREAWGQRPSTALDLPTQPQGSSPAFPPGAFKQPPFQTPPPPPAAQGTSKRALLVTLGALALAGVATGGFFAWQAVSNPTPTTAAAPGSATPSTPPAEEPAVTPSEAPGASVLNSEQTDPQKLSLSEAFPKKKVSAAGTTFTRVKASVETTCDKAASGAFAEALKEQKCSRVLRATYVDNKRRYAVTTGIAVLPTKDAATAVDQEKDLGKNVWFRPLPGADGSGGERVHIAGGYAAGLVWGRYIVFSYATHADGHTPAAKEKALPKVSGAFRDQLSLVLERRAAKG